MVSQNLCCGYSVIVFLKSSVNNKVIILFKKGYGIKMKLFLSHTMRVSGLAIRARN